MVEASGEGEDALVDGGEDVGVRGHVVVAFLDLGGCEVGESELLMKVNYAEPGLGFLLRACLFEMAC